MTQVVSQLVDYLEVCRTLVVQWEILYEVIIWRTEDTNAIASLNSK